MASRVPPQSIEAEQSLLGSLLLDPSSWDEVSDQLEVADFYKPAHQLLFTAIKSLFQQSAPVDLVTLTNELTAKGELVAVGGTDALAQILNSAISSANVGHYAQIIREKSLLRKIIQASSQVSDRAYTSDFQSLDQFLDSTEETFFRLAEQRSASGLMAPMGIVKDSVRWIEELYRRKSDITGISSGFAELDKMTSGLNGGELIILAARPSMGKTALSLNIAQHIALRQKKTVAYFSLEMGSQAVMMRVLASEARINMKDIRNGKINDSAWPKLIQVAGHVSDSHLYLDESSGISPFEVRSKARKLKSTVGLDAIMIDYLQLMKLKERTESREREVSEISRLLKGLAKELNIPVIALAQLNRGVEGRTEKRPMLSDLRESGSIEQDADIIMMLYREDYYDKDDPEKQGNAEIIVGKNRNGPTGTVKLRFEAEYARFKDADPVGQGPGPQGPGPQSPGPVTNINQGRPRNFAPGARA